MAPKRHRVLKVLVLSGSLGTLALVALVGLAFFMVLGLITDPLNGRSTSYGAGGFGAAPVISKGIRPADVQEEFAGELVACLPGLDPYVALGWTVAEGGGVNTGQPTNNFLFLSDGLGGWRVFASPMESAWAVCKTLGGNLYREVMAAMGQPPLIQLLAIAKSPWDEGHYGGDGSNLLSAYYSVVGSLSCKLSRGVPC